ncbi:MAG TPA: methylated-DNA--[protein]-cysteine S-methyltransferase, partial [Planctomycetota bacterium]|nr:methylated-DNA--[protein]-cysteine S-methyltransferase [Planctomycetota bacterium]
AWQRARRLGRALQQLRAGSGVLPAALDAGYDSMSGFTEAVRQLVGSSPARARDATVVHLLRVPTPLGPMLAGATEQGLLLLEFTDRRMLERQLKTLHRRLNCAFVPGSNPVLAQLGEELRAYFAGEPVSFRTPLLLPGSTFQREVWEHLRAIPRGATSSYAAVARAIGRPAAVRAVARANGDNRIAILVPCHRVIGSDGQLTGYGGGLWRKRWLLDLEVRPRRAP